jgi:uncharacterized protein
VRPHAVAIASVVLAAALAVGGRAAADPAAWRVAGRDGGELWLLGSMHLLRDQDYPLPKSIDALYERADVVVLELDLDDIDPVSQQATLLGAAVLPSGRELRDVVDADLYGLAEQEARELGLDLALLARFEPWLVAITLLDLGMNRIGYRADRGLEQYFVGQARSDGKEIIGLETLEMQLGIFDRLPESQQHALLAQTLRELEHADVAMQELTAAWKAGRLEALGEQLLADFADFPGLYEALVLERNRQWVKQIEGFLAERRTYLVVVGALHLVGDDSVVELLAARGHALTRVN